MSPALQRVRRAVPRHTAGPYVAEIQEFLAAVAELRAPMSLPLDARRDLEIVLRGYDALRQESWVDIEAYTPQR
jgi:predicted dehydrogenase